MLLQCQNKTMNNKAKLRKELATLLKKIRSRLVRSWSAQIYKVSDYHRLKDIIPKKAYTAGMEKFLRVLIYDIAHPTRHKGAAVLKRLILKDYLRANTVEDTIHGLIILRSILDNILPHAYKGQLIKLRNLRQIINAEVDRKILFLSRVYRKRDFSRLETIIRYGKKLITILDMDKLYRLILEAAVKESDSDRGSLMILEKDGYLHIKSSIGISGKVISGTRRRLGKGIAGRVAKTSRPIIINEGQRMPQAIKRSMLGLRLVSAVSIPIISRGRVIGVLNLGKYPKKPLFDEGDVGLLLILAYEAGAAISNCRLVEELQDFYLGSMVSLASAMDARDHSTQGHSEKVEKLAVATARRLQLSNQQIESIKCASLLHDIGKIGIPDRILLKPTSLTKREYAVIKKHPIFAVRILKHIPRLKNIIPIIYHEHERYDGKGYVEGLKAENIPIESRIIAIADAYEAMTSDRPYRQALPKKIALAELKRGSGTQFDPKVVKAFLEIIKK